MIKKPNMKKVHFNIGVVGVLDNSLNAEKANVKVTSVLSAIIEHVYANEFKYYKTKQDDICFDFYTSSLLSDDFWKTFCKNWNMGDLCVVEPESSEETKQLISPKTHVTTLSNSLKGVAQIHSMIDWVSCQVDIAFVLWDGNESSFNGSIWMFIERCKQNGVPCIWIDTTDLEKSYWFKNIYPEPFNREALWQHLDDFYIKDTLPEDVSQVQPQGYLFSRLWIRASTLYEQKRRIAPIFDRTKVASNQKDSIQIEDILLHQQTKQFVLEKQSVSKNDFETINENFEFLRDAFHKYESAADRISPAIRAVFFCRTWIPLLSTIFLAVGFYTETILRFLFGKQNLVLIGQWTVDTWAFIAGIGFLLSAFTFFYNRVNVKSHQKNLDAYIVCRYVDEYFRIVLHFQAYGMPVSERILNKAISNSDDYVKKCGAIRVHRLLRMRTPSEISIDAESSKYMVKHLNEFFDTQINYQTRGRKQRFQGILRRLNKGIIILLWINMIMLAVRGVLQFAAGSLPQIETLSADSPFLWLSYKNGGKNAVDFIRTFANLAALLFTAWYDKYLRQLNMNHYNSYSHIAEKILRELHMFKQKTTEIAALQKKGAVVSYDWFRSIADETLERLTAELYWWCDVTVKN